MPVMDGIAACEQIVANSAAKVVLITTFDRDDYLFDGLRAAYYPLSDDGTRNFVDLNTIPSLMVERIDTIAGGASAVYGADAVAGVVTDVDAGHPAPRRNRGHRAWSPSGSA